MNVLLILYSHIIKFQYYTKYIICMVVFGINLDFSFLTL